MRKIFIARVMELEELTKEVKGAIRPVPFKGIERFFDISGILLRPTLFQATLDQLAKVMSSLKPDFICALDSRGFLIGAPLSIMLKVPLVMIRKRGKLPGACHQIMYNKEYETGDVFEIQEQAVKSHSRIVIVDDVIATGGSMRAAFLLLERFEPVSVTGVCLMDLGLELSKTLKLDGKEVISLFNASEW
jgi:adenine phosphoribosyltransferase